MMAHHAHGRAPESTTICGQGEGATVALSRCLGFGFLGVDFGGRRRSRAFAAPRPASEQIL